MNFKYDSKSDMLYIELINKPNIESDEVAPGIVIDFDENDQAVGIEIEDASKRIDMSRLEISALPIVDLIVSKSEVENINSE